MPRPKLKFIGTPPQEPSLQLHQLDPGEVFIYKSSPTGSIYMVTSRKGFTVRLSDGKVFDASLQTQVHRCNAEFKIQVLRQCCCHPHTARAVPVPFSPDDDDDLPF